MRFRWLILRSFTSISHSCRLPPQQEIFHRKQIHSLTFQPEFKAPRTAHSSACSSHSSLAALPANEAAISDDPAGDSDAAAADSDAAITLRSRPRVPRSDTVLSTGESGGEDEAFEGASLIGWADFPG